MSLRSPEIAGGFFNTEPPGKPNLYNIVHQLYINKNSDAKKMDPIHFTKYKRDAKQENLTCSKSLYSPKKKKI